MTIVPSLSARDTQIRRNNRTDPAGQSEFEPFFRNALLMCILNITVKSLRNMLICMSHYKLETIRKS